jgi:hypothetical protein
MISDITQVTNFSAQNFCGSMLICKTEISLVSVHVMYAVMAPNRNTLFSYLTSGICVMILLYNKFASTATWLCFNHVCFLDP